MNNNAQNEDSEEVLGALLPKVHLESDDKLLERYSYKPIMAPVDAVTLVGNLLIKEELEHICMVYLDEDMRPICVALFSENATSHGVSALPGDVMRIGLLSNAKHIIHIHNHPNVPENTGHVDVPFGYVRTKLYEPSPTDIMSYDFMIKLGTPLGIMLYDGIIISGTTEKNGQYIPSYYSVREHKRHILDAPENLFDFFELSKIRKLPVGLARSEYDIMWTHPEESCSGLYKRDILHSYGEDGRKRETISPFVAYSEDDLAKLLKRAGKNKKIDLEKKEVKKN